MCKTSSPMQDQATGPMAKEFQPNNNRACLYEEAACGKLHPFTLETATGKAEYEQMPLLNRCIILACFRRSKRHHITTHIHQGLRGS